MAVVLPDIQDAPSFDGMTVWDKTDFFALSCDVFGTAVVSGMAVTQDTGSDMKIAVASGVVNVQGVQYTFAGTGGSPVTVGAASTCDRRDTVVYRVGTGIVVIAGTPCLVAGWNQYNINFNGPAKSLPTSSIDVVLAEIYVAASTTSIVGTTSTQGTTGGSITGNIVDKRNIPSGVDVIGGILQPSTNVESIIRANSLDQMTPAGGNVNLNGHSITNLLDPVSPQYAATKNYVDTVKKAAVSYATNGALSTNTYSNGTAGVGATLTATANAALVIDAVTVTAGNRVLIKNEVTASHNGIYTVTQVGSASLPYILTRVVDYDVAAQMNPGDEVLVMFGTQLSGTRWFMNQTSAITVGTTSITWTQSGFLVVASNQSLASNVTLPAATATTIMTTAALVLDGVYILTATVTVQCGSTAANLEIWVANGTGTAGFGFGGANGAQTVVNASSWGSCTLTSAILCTVAGTFLIKGEMSAAGTAEANGSYANAVTGYTLLRVG